jgi:hypothetical protein
MKILKKYSKKPRDLWKNNLDGKYKVNSIYLLFITNNMT